MHRLTWLFVLCVASISPGLLGCNAAITPAGPQPAVSPSDAGTLGGPGLDASTPDASTSPTVDAGLTCSTGTPCSGQCVDTQKDSANCGTCGNACGPLQTCSMGKCTCSGGLSPCGTDCVDLTSDASNCGMCGKACSGGQVCSNSTCTSSCSAGLTNCNGSCVDTTSNASNCGGCNMPCGSGEQCVNQMCQCATGFTSCGGSCVPIVSFSADVQPIFTSTCALSSCHGGVRPASNLNLSAGQAYSNLVNVSVFECKTSARTRVVPSAPSQSYIINKLTGVDMCTGLQMPAKGNLTSTQLDAIRAWICEGAKND